MSFKQYAQKALPKPFISGKPKEKFSGVFQPGDRIYYISFEERKKYGTFVKYSDENNILKVYAKWDDTYREYGVGWMPADVCFRAEGE